MKVPFLAKSLTCRLCIARGITFSVARKFREIKFPRKLATHSLPFLPPHPFPPPEQLVHPAAFGNKKASAAVSSPYSLTALELPAFLRTAIRILRFFHSRGGGGGGSAELVRDWSNFDEGSLLVSKGRALIKF